MTSLRDIEWQISYGPADDRLNRFYIPALRCSVRYDRSAGFFSSSALAVAAAGVAGLIANRGTMRLLVGAQLDPDDVQAIERGASLEGIVSEKLLAALEQPVEEVMRRRLEVLAWMVAQGTLQIRVVLPRDARGRPLPAEQAQDYYHPKEGVFTDAEGHQMAFSGSVNESMTGWQRNYEQFSVYFSWEASRPYLAQVVERFNRLWEGREESWIALDIPRAVRESLLRLAPSQPPRDDPLALDGEREARLRRERLIFQFVRDIPYFPHAEQLGAATCAITPWPHQLRVAQRVIETYPKRYLLCDEVGLGKTIEAGLVLRQLVISGRAKRCLLLVPKSVTRQWQEELYEKFVLDVPLFDGHRFWNYAGEELAWQYETDNPWDAFDLLIASSQLAKRRDRLEQITAARPWDLVLVDEAHHARRRDFQQSIYRPNRLLTLLTDPQFQAKAILLMTATPMQVHAVEVWDLLRILGLGGKWGADERNFLQFYSELMRPCEEVDWDFVYTLVRDYLELGGQLDQEFAEQARQALGLVNWQTLQRLPYTDRPSRTIKKLPREAREWVKEMARRHTPLRALMFRNTRELLREYVRQGLLKEKVPARSPELVWIPMRREERKLYQRIEEYISDFYRKYEDEHKGLGFVMTVYRRRLTSSFYAVERSLERRLAYLEGRAEQAFDDDDLEQADLEQDISETLEEAQLYQEEIRYVRDFLDELQHLSAHDSKTEQLIQDLNKIFHQRETVLVFTQYTDTMDYLRDKLRPVYGDQVACYSGRGGERWNGIAWVSVTKEEIKQAFREGADIKILLCTEAASEGLNLQTCGVLINYDMPWNPMRVEQRIGRIDRIGQVHDVVWIRNYFYEDTVEAQVYRALAKRINWFEGVVGDLQPILARVGQAIERLAMVAPPERERALATELREIEQQLEQKDRDILNVYETHEAVSSAPAVTAPLSLPELEQVLVNAAHFEGRFRPHPQLQGAYLLDTAEGEVSVTFDPQLFDRYPASMRFLAYGGRLLHELIEQVPPPREGEFPGIIRLNSEGLFPISAFYGLDSQNRPLLLQTLRDLESAMQTAESTYWSEDSLECARRDFEQLVQQVEGKRRDIETMLRKATCSVLQEKAILIVRQAAVIELTYRGNFDNVQNAWSAVATDNKHYAVLSELGYPFTPLVHIAMEQEPGGKILSSIPEPLLKDNSLTLHRTYLPTLKQQADMLLSQWRSQCNSLASSE